MSGELPPIRKSSERSCYGFRRRKWNAYCMKEEQRQCSTGNPEFVEWRATYELTMNIATNGDWTPDRLYVRFLHQDFPSLCRQEKGHQLRVGCGVVRPWAGAAQAYPRTLSQSFLTSDSESCLQLLSCSIQASISCSIGGRIEKMRAIVGDEGDQVE